MPEFKNSILVADNVDFSGSNPPVGQVTADGQLLIGSTASPKIKTGTLTAGTGINIVNASGAITISYTASNVVGPGSSTDNAIVRWDGTSGNAIQNSGNIIDDSNNLTGPSSITLDPGASGDPFIGFDINGTSEFCLGVDDSDSDALKVCLGGVIGTSDSMVAYADGEIVLPLQSAFFAYQSTAGTNVTGGSVGYYLALDTEIYDQNSDWDNSTYTFTAPVTGLYYFGYVVYLSDLNAGYLSSHYRVDTSNRNIRALEEAPGAVRDVNNEYSTKVGVLTNMDAADTAQFRIVVFNGTTTVDVDAGSTKTYGFAHLVT